MRSHKLGVQHKKIVPNGPFQDLIDLKRFDNTFTSAKRADIDKICVVVCKNTKDLFHTLSQVYLVSNIS